MVCGHCLNDFCIKVGSDERLFNVSLIARDKVTRQCPQTTAFEEKGEPKRIRTEVSLLTSLTPYQRPQRPNRLTKDRVEAFLLADAIGVLREFTHHSLGRIRSLGYAITRYFLWFVLTFDF